MQSGRNIAQPRSGRHPQGHAYGQQQSQHRAMIEQQRAKNEMMLKEKEKRERMSRRPADRDIPPEIAQLAIGDGVARYQQLRDVERRLDATVMQKRADLTDSYRRGEDFEGTLRLWISNTAEGQPWQLIEEGSTGLGEDGTFDFADSSQATYRVKIQSRLLDDSTQDAHEATENGTDSKSGYLPRPRFSDFFTAIRIDFDRDPSLLPDGMNSIEWQRPKSPDDPKRPRASNGPASAGGFDTLEFQRKGDEETNITIHLFRDHQPPRYKLSPPLADLLHTTEADDLTVIAGIWDYVRAHNLREDDEHRRFICDSRLRAIFGMDALMFPQLREILLSQSHLSPLPPLQLPYTIRLDKSYISPASEGSVSPSAPTIYDIRVPLPSPLEAEIRRITTSPTHISQLKAIQEIDADISSIIEAIHQSSSKHRFLTQLSEDPVRFIKRWGSSQKRDLEIILAEGGRGFGEDGSLPDALRWGGDRGVWGSDGVREAAGVWLARSRAH